jgi:hypothetical protein
MFTFILNLSQKKLSTDIILWKNIAWKMVTSLYEVVLILMLLKEDSEIASLL